MLIIFGPSLAAAISMILSESKGESFIRDWKTPLFFNAPSTSLLLFNCSTKAVFCGTQSTKVVVFCFASSQEISMKAKKKRGKRGRTLEGSCINEIYECKIKKSKKRMV